MIKETRTITAVGDDAASLGLRDDLADLSLATPPALRCYLDFLHDYLIEARMIRNYGNTRGDLPYWFETIDRDEPRLRETGKANGMVASLLLEIPSALVTWGRFDESAFVERMILGIEAFPSPLVSGNSGCDFLGVLSFALLGVSLWVMLVRHR